MVAGTAFTLTGPTAGREGVASTFVFTPTGGVYSGTITPTMTGTAGELVADDADVVGDYQGPDGDVHALGDGNGHRQRHAEPEPDDAREHHLHRRAAAGGDRLE